MLDNNENDEMYMEAIRRLTILDSRRSAFRKSRPVRREDQEQMSSSSFSESERSGSESFGVPEEELPALPALRRSDYASRNLIMMREKSVRIGSSRSSITTEERRM
uniref:Uncharacterized protein n=1 Tax=Cyclophora tenuis TaxID=216820 RepID=A0A7S1D908_CYCTE